MDEAVAVLAVAKSSQVKRIILHRKFLEAKYEANSHNKIINYLKFQMKFPSPRQLDFKKIKEIESQKVCLLPSWFPSSPADLGEKSFKYEELLNPKISSDPNKFSI